MIYQLFHSSEPISFEGQYYQLHEASLLPRPLRVGGPPILIGGNGIQRTLPLVANYANVWNVFHLTPDTFRRRSEYLDKLLLQANRGPSSVKRTLMVMVLCDRNETELKRRTNFVYRNWLPELRDQPFENLIEALAGMFNPLLNSVGATFCPLVGTPESVIKRSH